MFDVARGHLEPRFAKIYFPIASCRINSNKLSRFELLRSMLAPDNRWDSKFAADNSGVRSAAALIGHYGGSDFHNRFPVGVGHRSHQYFPAFKIMKTAGIQNNARLPCRDT